MGPLCASIGALKSHSHTLSPTAPNLNDNIITNLLHLKLLLLFVFNNTLEVMRAPHKQLLLNRCFSLIERPFFQEQLRPWRRKQRMWVMNQTPNPTKWVFCLCVPKRPWWPFLQRFIWVVPPVGSAALLSVPSIWTYDGYRKKIFKSISWSATSTVKVQSGSGKCLHQASSVFGSDRHAVIRTATKRLLARKAFKNSQFEAFEQKIGIEQLWWMD